MQCKLFNEYNQQFGIGKALLYKYPADWQIINIEHPTSNIDRLVKSPKIRDRRQTLKLRVYLNPCSVEEPISF